MNITKFYTIIFALLFNISIANSNIEQQTEESGLFVGVNIGISIMQVNFYDSYGIKKEWKDIGLSNFHLYGNESETQGNLGLKIGWNKFLNKLFGIRIYANYDYSNFRYFLTNAKIATEDISIISEFMFNFFNSKNFSIGIFTGIGVGYKLLQWNNMDIRSDFEKYYSYNGFIVPISVGISTTIIKKHKIEISTKIPTIRTSYKYNKERLEINPYILSIGYSYIF